MSSDGWKPIAYCQELIAFARVNGKSHDDFLDGEEEERRLSWAESFLCFFAPVT